jgi:drug/metabolite transporter (DMT)-like permease
MTHVRRATVIGASSVLLWSTLAILVLFTENHIPPFQLLSMTFFIAFALMWVKWRIEGHSGLHHFKQPVLAWLLGVGGLFGYHLALFIAFAHAPAVEANLINYLWPLLIVLFAAFLPGEHFRWQHVVGALLALAGCWMLLGGKATGFDSQYILGYGAAVVAALTWSSYSVLSRLVKSVPTDAVGWFCAVTAVLAGIFHLMLEQTQWPANSLQWIGVIGLGLGPVGLAFFTWDHGIKHGNIQLLGVLAFGAPLLSTIILVAMNKAPFSITLLLACVAITLGAFIASRSQSRPVQVAD